MAPYLWKESKWENANKEVVESCDRGKERVCAKKGEDVSIIKERERRSIQVYWRTIEKEIY